MAELSPIEQRLASAGIASNPDVRHLVQVLRKAREVRAAQKEYFSKRDKSVMIESKRLEGELDRMIAPEIPKQESLIE